MKLSLTNLFFVVCVLVVLFASCAKQSGEKTDKRGSEYIENYISKLKDIEKMTTEKFNKTMFLFEYASENPTDSALIQIRDAITESTSANRKAVEEFRMLADKSKPRFVDDTVQILLTTATALLGQSYEVRNEAYAWLNRYISLGTPRFFSEYSQQMEGAMQLSRQAFFFLTTARVRQRVITGDTLDMTFSEFLNIPELPQDTAVSESEIPDSADTAETVNTAETADTTVKPAE